YAAAAAGDGDPYGYPIKSYDATDILHRAAIETARMEGRPPPPAPTRYTYMDNRTGPRVGPGLRKLKIAIPPPWLHNYKEMHKVLRYWSEEQAADIERLASRNPALQLDIPECLSTETLLASGYLGARDLPEEDSDSDMDEEGRPLPEGAPRAAMEWRAEGPGHVPAYRHVLAPDPPLPPPTLSWEQALQRAAQGLRRPLPDPLPLPPAVPPVPYLSDEQLAWEQEYDKSQLPRVRRVDPSEVDLVEMAWNIWQHSRPGAAIQL
ncbi:hypothetical protein Agub_g11490, partial [Astrephomene gubernaculifera]